jgi:hypothetical protein
MTLQSSPSKRRSASTIRRHRSAFVIGFAVLVSVLFLFGMLFHHRHYNNVHPPWVKQKELFGSPQFKLDATHEETIDFASHMDNRNKKHAVGHKSNRDKFDFSVHEPGQDYGKIDRIWQCHEPIESRNQHKLVFVHNFKTAGSTIRAVLGAYAHYCKTAIALVVSCTTLSYDSMSHSSAKWKNNRGRRKGSSCALKLLETRDNTLLDGYPHNNINTTLLENHHVDILAGHVPIGSDAKWNYEDGKHVRVTYFTMFRDSVSKYVSGVLFKSRDKHLSLNETVAMIKTRVMEDRKYGNYYERYSGYLISPKQWHDFQRAEVSFGHANAANLVMSNLVDNNVVIGLVERMAESLELLQYLIDSDGSMSEMFQYFGMKDKSGNVKQTVQINKSQMSTSDVVAELEKDPKFMVELRDYVKWDEKVNAFARDLHMRQYQWMQQEKSKSRGARRQDTSTAPGIQT